MIYAEQHTDAGKYLRSFSRGQWRMLARMERIALREANKALVDLMMYGAGCVRITGADPEYIPFSEWHT